LWIVSPQFSVDTELLELGTEVLEIAEEFPDTVTSVLFCALELPVLDEQLAETSGPVPMMHAWPVLAKLHFITLPSGADGALPGNSA
jgi:hypothetical protein